MARRHREHDGLPAQRAGRALRTGDGDRLSWARGRRDRGDGGRAGPPSRPEGSPSGGPAVTNLSEWALKHRAFTVFLMIVVTLAGLSSYFGLGRNEDPAFTFRTMVVQAAWPGATLDDTLKQVTERLERKLQETRGLDFLRSYTTPGLTTIFVNLKGSTSASEVPDVWYQVRKNIGDIRHTLPAGVVGPGFNDDFGDTFGLIHGFTADGFTHRELRDYVEAVRSRLLNVPDVSKIEIIGAQDEQIFIEFSTQQLAGLGIDRAALIAAVQAQNSVVPAGSVQTSNEKLSLQVSGDFRSEQDILNVNFLSNGRMIRLRDIAEVRRSYADPPQPMFRVNGKPAIGLAISMRNGGDILALGRNVQQEIDDAVVDLPLGIEPALVSDQPAVVDHAIGEFMISLWQALGIIMAVSIISIGLRPGTIVTAAGFVPIGFAQSAAGEYTFSIFAVVTIALFVSWFIAVLFAPLLGVVLLKPPKSQEPAKPNVVLRVFRSFLVGAMRVRWITIAVTLGSLVAAFLALPFVPRQFFPASDRPELVVDMTLPRNASIYASDTIAGRLDAFLKGDPDVERWSTYVGRGAIRFYLPLDVKLANDFFAQAVVVAKDVAARDRLQSKLEKMMSEQMPSVVGRVSPLELGPPVGWPVQYRVSGPDLSQVRSIALRLAEVLGGDPHISEISYDWMEPARQVRVTIDQDQARLLGLSSRTIAEVINTLMAGTPITQVRDDIYLIPVITRALDEQRSSLSTLRALQLPLPNGRTVPLSQVATFDFKQEYPLIWRRQRVPTLTVLADVPPAVSPASAVDALAPAIEKFRESLPKDYHIAVGGTVEESANSQASVFAKVPLMLLLMLFFLMAQLHSFSRLFLVVSVIPMGLIGIVFTLLIVGKPLGFVAILGILALFGMIARNAVLLIEQIETERTQRPHVWDAVVEATLSRFRPIMLTAISTVLGFIPIAADVFWGPMAFAILGGLFVATILTLIVLPALYVALFRIKEPTQETVAAGPAEVQMQR